MTTQSTITGKGRIAKIAIATVILLALVLAPAFGEVRSARARVLQRPNAPTTVRKANFQAGDILTTPLVSITVVNDPTPAFLKLGLELEFGGSWAGDYLKGSIIKRLGANESITFDNTKLLDNLGSVRWADVSNSSTLTEHTGVTGVSTIGNLKNLPEGTYTLYLTVSEVTLSNPNDIQSTITSETELIKKSDPNAKVEFKVVTIGGIAGISLPTVTNKSLSFQVPEIPIYSDSRSSTKIIINGPGITNYTATKSHAKSEGVGGLKGYPSDLTNGYVTYDLTALNFRAGQNYTIDIEFIDWNNLPITSKTTSVTFPAVRMSGTTDLADPYLPVFSWAFSGTDYADWVKEYRVYIDGAYKGYTADTTWQPRDMLTPGTAYTWYAMPINKDGTPFLDSAAAITRSFTTAAHTKMDVAITQPANGAVLFKDQAYTFTGTAAYYDGAVEKSGGAVWRFGSETKSGLEVQYTPRARATSGSPLQASLTVTDSLNLAKSSSTISMTVLAPAIALQGETTRQVDKGASVTLAATPTDLAQVEWFMDGTSIGTGATRAYTFTEVGAHKVYAEGTSAADVDGRTKTVRTGEITFNVAGAAPVVTFTQPRSIYAPMRRGSRLTMIAGIEHENPLASTTWTVVGPDASQSGATGTTFNFQPQATGEYTITVTAVDTSQKQGQASMRILVISTLVTLTSPTANQVFSTTDLINVQFTAPGASSYRIWNGRGYLPAGPFRISTPGTYSIRVYATYNILNSEGVPTPYEEYSIPTVDIIVRDVTPLVAIVDIPRPGFVLRSGVSYTFTARVQAQAAQIADQWWDVDGTRLSGNTYTPAAGLSKQVMATFHVKSSSEVETKIPVPMQVISPSAQLVWTGPSNYEIQAGLPVPIVAVLKDAEAFGWRLDANQGREPDWDRVLTAPGTHRLAMEWSAESNTPPAWEKYPGRGLSNTIAFTVYSNEPPVISSGVPAASILRYAAGDTVNFSVSATGANPVSEIRWRVLRDGSSIRDTTGTSLAYTFAEPGSYTVRATAVDSRGGSADREWLVKVIAPSIGILTPLAGTTYAAGNVPAPTLRTQDLDSYTFILDGNAVPANFVWTGISAGPHSIGAEGSYLTSASATPRKITAQAVTFTVANRTPPVFTVEGVREGDRLIAGRQYTFTTTRAGAETITWIRSGSTSTFNGPSYSFTPAASDREISFTARGLLNGITVDKTFKINVVDPYVNIIVPNQPWFPVRSPIPLQAEKRAIDRMEWSVNGQAFTGTSVALPAGQHSIAVKGFAAGVRLPSGAYGDWEYSGTGKLSTTVRVADAPRLTGLTLSSQATAAGGAVTATVAVAGDASLGESITFLIDGNRVASGSAVSHTFTNISAGQHAVRAVLAVSGGTESIAEAALTAFGPVQIAITRPANGAVFAPDANVDAAMEIRSGQATSLEWVLDGSPAPNSNSTIRNFGRLASGSHRIEVRATNPAGATASAAVSITVPSDFALGLAAPAADTDLLIGNPLTFLAQVNKVAGSDINVADAAQFISWFVDGQDTGTKGLSYRFAASTAGERTVQARYTKDGLTRVSPERKIRVREIAEPAILLPLNGFAIRYAVGSPITLKATGEPGATFSWSIDGAPIATGSETSFVPGGISGQKQIKLVTSAYGRSLERFISVTMTPNNPPVLALTAPAVQYSGQNLVYNATAIDPDEQNQALPVSLTFDGLPILAGATRPLTDADIGTHTLAATAVDAMGTSVSKQVEVKVGSDRVAIDILSPMPGQLFTRQINTLNETMRLIAVASLPGESTMPFRGFLNWTIQYLDNPSLAPQTASGSPSQASAFTGTGEVLVTARYFRIISWADGREENKEIGSKSVRIRVEDRATTMSIAWPHGRVVNAGTRLTPSLSGVFIQDLNQARWTLDGIAIPNIGALVAPDQSGTHVLAATYTANGVTSRAEFSFEVNRAPRIRITSPAAGAVFQSGSPLLLAAAVEDDQSADIIIWSRTPAPPGSGPMGEGPTLLVRETEPGAWRLTARVTDPYGASAEATADYSMAAPLTGIIPVVNGGLPAYLLGTGSSPLAANVRFTGGIRPQATWVMSQGAVTQQKTGAEVMFTPADLAAFTEGPAFISMTLTDAGIADEAARPVVRRDFTIELTRSAVLEKIRPTQDFTAYVGEPVPIELAVAGFTAPTYTFTIDGQPLTLPWSVTEGGARYASEIPATFFQREGVYQIAFTMTSGGASRTASFSLNVYQRRAGLFVDNPPATLDLQAGVPVTVRVTNTAPTPNIVYMWKSDLSSTAFYMGSAISRISGDSVRLDTAPLRPGTRTITVQVQGREGQPGTSASFTLQVLGPMQLEVQPSGDSWTMLKGTDLTSSARARDRDGAELAGGSIRWSSHLAGPLGSGERLPAAALQNLAAGEHVITVSATGATGGTISAIRTLRIIAAPTGGGGGGNDGGGGGGGGSGGGDGGSGDFDEGESIGGPSGGQGILGNNNLLQRFGLKR